MPDKIITDQNLDQFAGQLGEQWAYDQVAFVVEFITETPSSGDAYRFLRKFEPALNKSKVSDDLAKKYSQLLLRLKFIALPLLELQEIIDLFQDNFLYAINNDISVVDRIKRMFPESEASSEDLNTRSALIQALEKNSQKIGNDGLGNWLKAYKAKIGEKQPGTLEIVSFITEDKNASVLDSNTKDILKQCLSFYNWFKYKSIDVAEALGINR